MARVITGTNGGAGRGCGRAPEIEMASWLKRRSGADKHVEWVGGIVSMPRYVMGEGEPYRPDMLVWLVPPGPVLGFETAKPGELLARASASLQATMQKPMHGAPHVPTRVRVPEQALADALRPGMPPGIELVCAPAPELDAFVEEMFERMGDGEQSAHSYLAGGVDPAALAAFFRAAAGLHRSAPWNLVPGDQDLVSATIDSLDVHNAVLSVVGQAGECFGVLMFAGVDDFETYLGAADAIEHDEQPEMVPHLVLTFERAADVPASLRKEATGHGWEIAAARAFPWLMAIDEDLVARPLTARELAIFEAIALALPELLSDGRVADAFAGRHSLTRTLRVATHAGELEVTLGVPCLRRIESRAALPEDLLAALAERERTEDGLDDEERLEIEDEIMQRFVASPEAGALSNARLCAFTLDYAASHLGVTLASLRAEDLREIVFDIIPRKVSIEASEAGAIIEANRAFFTFLGRELGFAQTEACLRVLSGDAARKLEAALSDPRNFGMAKSMMMAGRDQGFDIGTQAGAEAWLRELQHRPLPQSIPLPPAATSFRPDPAAARAKKNRRKAERKARKKNR